MTLSHRFAHIERCGTGNPGLEWFLPQPEPWMEAGLCAQVDGELFFPEKGGSTREAKRICQGCEVRSECLEYALAHLERYGIWGGLSERQRRRLLPPPKPRAPMVREPREHYDRRAAVVQRMAAEGWAISQISDELGLSGDIVRKALRRVIPECMGLAS